MFQLDVQNRYSVEHLLMAISESFRILVNIGFFAWFLIDTEKIKTYES